MPGKTGFAFIITASDAQFKRAMRDGWRYLDAQEKKVRRLAWQYRRLRNQALSYGKIAAGLVVGLFLREALTAAVDFERSLSRVQAVTQATTEQMRALGDQAKQLGLTTQFSAAQAAEGMIFLGQAGYDTNQILASMPAVLHLAAAGQLEMARAGDIASNILAGFGLAVEETNRVVDVLTATSINSNTNIEQMSEAMKLAAPIAAQFGASIEETAGAAGILGNNGIQATLAGTGLRGIMLALVNPSAKAAMTLNEMGVATHFADGEIRPLVDIMEDLAAANLDLEKAGKIFRREQVASALILSKSTGDWRELIKVLEQSKGVTEEVAEKVTDNLAGAWTEFRSAIGGLGIAIFESGLGDALTALVDLATGGIRAVGGFFEWTADKYQALKDNITALVDLFERLYFWRTGGGQAMGAILPLPDRREQEEAKKTGKALAESVMSAETASGKRLEHESRIRDILRAQVDLVKRQVDLSDRLFEDSRGIFDAENPVEAARKLVAARGEEVSRLLNQLQAVDAGFVGPLTPGQREEQGRIARELEVAEKRLTAAYGHLATAQGMVKETTEALIPPSERFNFLLSERNDLLAISAEDSLAMMIEHSIPPLQEADNLMWKLSDGTKVWFKDLSEGLKRATLQFDNWADIVNAWLRNLAVTGGDIFGRILLSSLFPKHGDSILAGIPGFASGGILPAGRVGIVGERGPEFIQSATATRITPMQGMGDVYITQNVTFGADVRDQEAMIQRMKAETVAAVRAGDAQMSRRRGIL